jgi:predicted ATPase/class 3 adenylate cyclase/DNA-binding CsgD family transcriptional regulator
MPDLPIGTLTFLFSDIASSTRLWDRHNNSMPAALVRYHAMLRDMVESHQGVVFKTVGDSLHAVFASASDAVAAAVATQQALYAEPWGTDEPLRVRIALHTGVAHPRAGDYFGAPLNRAARLLAAAHGGQILLSLVTAELVRDQMPPDIALRDLGMHRLRDLSRPEQILQLLVPGLPADFPPLNTLDRRPHNLPTHTTAVIGREWEISNIWALLSRGDVRLMTLTGPGGAGKTRLALQAAADLLDQFDDGVYHVELSPISDAGLVPQAIAHALGLKETGKRAIEDILKEYLADRQILLVLDNFEQVLNAALPVGQLLSATSRLKILVTSRIALRLYGEHEFSVPPLTLPDREHLPPTERLGYYESIRLFSERAQATRSDFAITEANAAAVVEICHQLDGLPLAIELAAARSKLFSPAALLERLKRPLALLTGGARDLPARQQTLRATIDWSYELLPADARTLLLRMAVFVDGCTLEAIEAICGKDGWLDRAAGVEENVERLLDHSLLRQAVGGDGEPRLAMLETIRQYAADRLTADEELQAVHMRHADYYLTLAERADSLLLGPEQGLWLARLETEHENLHAALEWYRAIAPECCLRLACALWRFWEMHSHLNEGRSWLGALLQLPEMARTPLRARALHGAGVLAYLQGDYQQSGLYLQEGLELSRALRDDQGVASILGALGLVAWFQGEHAAARTQLETSVALFRDVRYTWGTADALHWLGHVVLDQGDVAAARGLFEEALTLFRVTGDKRNIALPLKDFGLIASQQGDHAAAWSLYEESLALSRVVEDVWHVAETLQRLADLARLQGDYERAVTRGQENLELWRRLGNKGGIAETLNLLGELARLGGDSRQATAYFTESLELLRTLGSKRIIAGVLHNLGTVAQHDRDFERATTLQLESLELNAAIEYLPGIADCFVGLAAVAAATGSAERAALLLGAAEPHLAAMRGYMPLIDRASYEHTLAAARALLDDVAFEAALTRGRALELGHALALASGQMSPSEPVAPTPQPPPAVAPAGLTEREVAVLHLVAQGLTDAQVAERLVISPRTVNGHLRSIYSKLGVSSRTAAAHFAVTQGLV